MLRSHRVPILNSRRLRRRILIQAVSSMARQAPTHDGRFQRAARLVIAPASVDVGTGEGQLIRAAVILTKYLDRQARWRDTRAIELGQSSFACCHLYSPKCRGAPTPRFQKNPRPVFSFAGKSQRLNAVSM